MDVGDFSKALVQLPDGTVRQVSAINGTIVWTVPGRANRPLGATTDPARDLGSARVDDWCSFCSARYLQTPPEKSRLVLASDQPGPQPWRVIRDLPADGLNEQVADFRCIPNLFEILSNRYWQANHGFRLPADVQSRARRYVATPAGRRHVLDIVRTRMRAVGATEEQLADDPSMLKLGLALFAGTHDVIVARRHFVDGATREDELASAGDLSPLEHEAYLALTIQSLADMYRSNPFIRNVAVFQNWLRPAGASIEHLHRQLVGIDEFGPQLDHEVRLLGSAPGLFTEILGRAAGWDLLIAGNEHAVAVAGVGHRYPTVEVYSTAAANRPWEHDPAALRGISDILHATHAATGSRVPTNEEWHYRPPDSATPMPWRINLKWRVSTPAGFEGITGIYVNTIDPRTLRDRLVAALLRLRESGRIEPMAIGAQCARSATALGYLDG